MVSENGYRATARDGLQIGPDGKKYTPQTGDPDFIEVWRNLPETNEAEIIVKKLSLADKRKLMVIEGEFVQETSDEPYDQWKVTERSEKMVTALSIPPAEVHERAAATQRPRRRRRRRRRHAAIM